MNIDNRHKQKIMTNIKNIQSSVSQDDYDKFPQIKREITTDISNKHQFLANTRKYVELKNFMTINASSLEFVLDLLIIAPSFREIKNYLPRQITTKVIGSLDYVRKARLKPILSDLGVYAFNNVIPVYKTDVDFLNTDFHQFFTKYQNPIISMTDIIYYIEPKCLFEKFQNLNDGVLMLVNYHVFKQEMGFLGNKKLEGVYIIENNMVKMYANGNESAYKHPLYYNDLKDKDVMILDQENYNFKLIFKVSIRVDCLDTDYVGVQVIKDSNVDTGSIIINKKYHNHHNYDRKDILNALEFKIFPKNVMAVEKKTKIIAVLPIGVVEPIEIVSKKNMTFVLATHKYYPVEKINDEVYISSTMVGKIIVDCYRLGTENKIINKIQLLNIIMKYTTIPSTVSEELFELIIQKYQELLD
jgi:hypothetical protein